MTVKRSPVVQGTPRVLVLCAGMTGFDAVAEVLRRGCSVECLVGLHADSVKPSAVSGWADVELFAARWGLAYRSIVSYDLSAPEDMATLQAIPFDLIWVAAWQRLVPGWLLELAPLGAIGTHGSPDGIERGRGRSPQNWALMLGCRTFELSLFRLTPGVDDGPVLATRSFAYTEADDIAVSYYRVSLATAEMVCEVLKDPAGLERGTEQQGSAEYYPQRLPADGVVDWSLPQGVMAPHCRALTQPYPGLRTQCGNVEIVLWHCIPFDDRIDSEPGIVGPCFSSGEFLVACGDGRILVRRWEASDGTWVPRPGDALSHRPFRDQLRTICDRHARRFREQKISRRLARWLE